MSLQSGALSLWNTYFCLSSPCHFLSPTWWTKVKTLVKLSSNRSEGIHLFFIIIIVIDSTYWASLIISYSAKYIPLHCPFVRAFLQIPVSLRQMNGSADFSVRPSLETSIFLFPLLPFQPSFPTQTTGHLHRAHEAGLHDVPHYLLSKSLFHLPYSKSPSSRHLRTQVGRLGSKEPMVTWCTDD